MTREEAIKMLKSKMDGHTDTSYEWVETIRMAIKALEQEPCKDCVSRQAVLELAKEECETAIIPYRKFVKDVNALPFVTPQPKTVNYILAKEELIDELEVYTVGRLKKSNVQLTVEELQNFIDKLKALD